MKNIVVAIIAVLLVAAISYAGIGQSKLYPDTGISTSTITGGSNFNITSPSPGVVQGNVVASPTFTGVTINSGNVLVNGSSATPIIVYETDDPTRVAAYIQSGTDGGGLVISEGGSAKHNFSRTTVTINDSSTSTGSFRAETDNKEYALFVNAASDQVIINGATNAGNTVFGVNGNSTFIGIVNATGIINGVPGMGELYFNNFASPLSMGGSTAFTNITGLTNGVTSGGITLSGTNGTFTVTVSGNYELEMSTSVIGTATDTVAVTFGVNGAAQGNCTQYLTLESTGATALPTHCFLSLTSGQVVTGMTNSAAGAAVTFPSLNATTQRLN